MFSRSGGCNEGRFETCPYRLCKGDLCPALSKLRLGVVEMRFSASRTARGVFLAMFSLAGIVGFLI